MKNLDCVDDILTNCQESFKKSVLFETKWSGFHDCSVPIHKPILSKLNT